MKSKFVCPKCSSPKLIMQQKTEIVAEVFVTGTKIETKEQESDISTFFTCQDCAFILPCSTEQELMDYIKQQIQMEEGVNFIRVLKSKQPGIQFVVEFYSGDFDKGYEMVSAKQVKYAEELAEALFGYPEVNIRFMS